MRIVIGVMGPGESATPRDIRNAEEIGRLIASEGWVLLTGGRAAGVMDAAARGAKDGGGFVVGILPGYDHEGASEGLDLAIPTDMGHARNVVNVHASHVVIACGMGCGTASEVALALKVGKPVILIGASEATRAFFDELANRRVAVIATDDPAEAIVTARRIVAAGWPGDR